MALSAAVSVASFSVVLAESFAAVAASSLVPATFLSLARAAKATGTGPSVTEGTALMTKNLGGDGFTKALAEAAKAITDIDLLVPKTARITGDFEFQARDSASIAVSGGVQVNVVTVNAGFAALYESSSKNKVHLEVDYVSVNYAL